jgi:adenylate kinase
MANYALTGTPGTGKTSLKKHLNKKIISLSEYYEQASEGKTDNGEWIVDIEKLDNILEDSDCNFFEGNFSHKLDKIDKVIVLRCDPQILEKRLESRNYSKNKVRENLEAEAIGLIYSEAIEIRDRANVFQVDNSTRKPQETANIIEKYINDNIKVEEEIDYSEKILDWY